MFSKASIVAIFASFAAAQHVAVGDPTGNPITRPLNEVVPACQAFTITWTPTTTNTISLILLRGPSTNVVPLGAPLAVGIPNSGSFTWTPASTLEADVSHYGLQLIDDVNGQYQYSTQFGISKDACSVSSSSVVASSSAAVYPSSAVVVASSSADTGYGYGAASSSAAAAYSTPAAVTKSAVSSLSPPYPTVVPGTGAGYNSSMVIVPSGTAPASTKPSATSSTNGTAVFTGAADAKHAGLTFVGAFAALAYFL
ncbi:hypothetical protein P153DRAFT_401152 [Dothidotthia symphoricarpi CBS 119687]|uniref:Yeast cell wall synthesis Kre9/Knh1-like N-terminal domain-containing protein n=1 Tax=Dothidotthia symphoricarpi CBS 119687 TaxID=1392245 RepID=A0A6A6A1F2_9PLEO|nr:uncharacterized protein P153DRAFT_401152 [Dothidotthia symphoricarpi CBS 119687]KAF2124548.1 hypothetical protein P153DRAFT_401152 [Dothidotthia symphoricarpi CBS 119687]